MHVVGKTIGTIMQQEDQCISCTPTEFFALYADVWRPGSSLSGWVLNAGFLEGYCEENAHG